MRFESMTPLTKVVEHYKKYGLKGNLNLLTAPFATLGDVVEGTLKLQIKLHSGKNATPLSFLTHEYEENLKRGMYGTYAK